MADIIVIIIIAVLLTASITHIVKGKKKGRTCMGCPSSGSCNKCNCEKK